MALIFLLQVLFSEPAVYTGQTFLHQENRMFSPEPGILNWADSSSSSGTGVGSFGAVGAGVFVLFSNVTVGPA